MWGSPIGGFLFRLASVCLVETTWAQVWKRLGGDERTVIGYAWGLLLSGGEVIPSWHGPPVFSAHDQSCLEWPSSFRWTPKSCPLCWLLNFHISLLASNRNRSIQRTNIRGPKKEVIYSKNAKNVASPLYIHGSRLVSNLLALCSYQLLSHDNYAHTVHTVTCWRVPHARCFKATRKL